MRIVPAFILWVELEKSDTLQCAEMFLHVTLQELSWDGLRWCLKAITQKELWRNHKIICKPQRRIAASDVPSAHTHFNGLGSSASPVMNSVWLCLASYSHGPLWFPGPIPSPFVCPAFLGRPCVCADYLDGTWGNKHRNLPRSNMVNGGARGSELHHKARQLEGIFPISESPWQMHNSEIPDLGTNRKCHHDAHAFLLKRFWSPASSSFSQHCRGRGECEQDFKIIV